MRFFKVGFTSKQTGKPTMFIGLLCWRLDGTGLYLNLGALNPTKGTTGQLKRRSYPTFTRSGRAFLPPWQNKWKPSSRNRQSQATPKREGKQHPRRSTRPCAPRQPTLRPPQLAWPSHRPRRGGGSDRFPSGWAMPKHNLPMVQIPHGT